MAKKSMVAAAVAAGGALLAIGYLVTRNKTVIPEECPECPEVPVYHTITCTEIGARGHVDQVGSFLVLAGSSKSFVFEIASTATSIKVDGVEYTSLDFGVYGDITWSGWVPLTLTFNRISRDHLIIADVLEMR